MTRKDLVEWGLVICIAIGCASAKLHCSNQEWLGAGIDVVATIIVTVCFVERRFQDF